MTTTNQFPLGWDEARVQKVIANSENQTEYEALVEDETKFKQQEEQQEQIAHLIHNQ